MSDEYIEKEDAIQSIIAHDLVGGDARGWAEYLLENTSTADVAPVRHSYWLQDGKGFSCRSCGRYENEKSPYCRLCGSVMDGGDEE